MSEGNAQPGEFCWHRLVTPDIEDAKKFYTELFGWNSEDITVNGAKATVFSNGNKKIAHISKMPDQSANSLSQWISFITVENIHIIVHRAKKLGCKIELPVTAFTSFGGLVAILLDPQGARVGVWQASDDEF